MGLLIIYLTIDLKYCSKKCGKAKRVLKEHCDKEPVYHTEVVRVVFI